MLQAILESGGAVVIAKMIAEEALDVLERITFDVLVRDVAMARDDGLIRQLRNTPALKRVPAIAIAAVARPADLLTAGYNSPEDAGRP